jgi:acetyl esterase
MEEMRSRKVRFRIWVVASLVVLLVVTTAGAVAAGQRSQTVSRAGDGAPVSNEASTQVAVELGIVWRTVDGEKLALDTYLPAGGGNDRAAVVLIHGGGWSAGDKSALAEQAQQLAELGYVAIAVNYRLVPEHPLPAALEDVQAAVSWLRADAQVRHYGIDPHRIGVLGASAGGQLAAMLGTVGTGANDAGSRVAAVVTWSGVFDFTTVGIDDASLLGCGPASCPEVAAAASPIAHVDRTDAPTLLVTSAEDAIVPATQSTAMAAALSGAAVENQLIVIDGSAHAVLGDAAWAATVAFLDAHLQPNRVTAKKAGAA